MKEAVLVPGERFIFSGAGGFPRSVILLVGDSGSGKTEYCIEFLRMGLGDEENCLYLSCSPRLNQDRFNSFFKGGKAPDFLSLFESQTGRLGTLASLSKRLAEWLDTSTNAGRKRTRVVIDSVTDLSARFPLDEVHKFVADIYDSLISADSAALLTMSAINPAAPPLETVGSLVDGIIQLRIEDSGDTVKRSMRLYSLRTAQATPKWIEYTIDNEDNFSFAPAEPKIATKQLCKLCDAPIVGQVVYSDPEHDSFHPNCLDTYGKINELYGSHTLYALEPGVIHANFFFVDIVGLSNPLLSVERQIGKIKDLNSLILSCEAFAKSSKDKKIVLPTGDGMAVGFLLNPELPLQLSIQLHEKLRRFNARLDSDKHLGVRIGLSAGPVFVVRDVNNNQNVWGPGIILARRVMDMGNDGHILLAGNIAETLIGIKDEYRDAITLIRDDQKLKHGQSIKLYSAHSREFGNPSIPSRLDLG